MEMILYDTLYAALKVLFLFVVPLLVAVSLAGLATSSFQAVTSIRDEAVLYSVKLLAVAAVLYFTLPTFIDAIMELTRVAFSGTRV